MFLKLVFISSCVSSLFPDFLDFSDFSSLLTDNFLLIIRVLALSDFPSLLSDDLLIMSSVRVWALSDFAPLLSDNLLASSSFNCALDISDFKSLSPKKFLSSFSINSPMSFTNQGNIGYCDKSLYVLVEYLFKYNKYS